MCILQKIHSDVAANNLFKKTATKRLDTLETKTNTLESKTNDNTNKINQLESQIASISSSSLQSLSDGWNEQRKLRTNINIIGIPSATGENLSNGVMDIFIFYGLSITASDIEAVYRVRYAKSNMNIVKFVNFAAKLSLINAKKSKKLSIGDIPSVDSSIASSSKEIFSNTHCTSFVGRLLYRGRTAVMKKQIAACWMPANSLLIKVTNESEPLMVKSMSDFDKILGQSDTPLNEPASFVAGKRRSNEISPNMNDSQARQKQRTTSSRVSSIGPLSSKNKNKAVQKDKK